MMECLVIGDSIAVGTQYFRRECAIYAQVGITSGEWYSKNKNNDLSAGAVIISLGSNDSSPENSYKNLIKIRALVKSNKVFWIQPNKETHYNTAMNVEKISKIYGDTMLVNEHWQRDGTHPSYYGYKKIAEKTK